MPKHSEHWSAETRKHFANDCLRFVASAINPAYPFPQKTSLNYVRPTQFVFWHM